VRSERVSDQTAAGWDIEVGKAAVISTPCEIGQGGLKAHRSRIWRLWLCHENLQGGVHSVG